MNDSWPREPQGRELENLTQLFKILGNSELFPHEGFISNWSLRSMCQ